MPARSRSRPRRRGPARGHPADPPYTPGDAPSARPRPARDARRRMRIRSRRPAADRPVRILTGAPTSLDPAVQGDAGSAAITAQLFESLTTFDLDLQLRPALAESWRFDDGGRRVTFHLRPGLTFSDGTPLRPSDVVPELAPAHRPGPAVAAGVARARHQGRRGRTCAGARRIPRRSGCTPTIRPATWSSTSSGRPPTSSTSSPARRFAVVPPGVGTDQAALLPGPGFVASGGYVLTGTTATRSEPDRQQPLLGRDAGDLEDRARRRPRRAAARSRRSRTATSTTPA